jgi:hypothetical protein
MVCLVAAGALARAGAAETPSRTDAAALKLKIAGIAQTAASVKPQPRRTTVTQNEVNAYLAFEAGDKIPDGIVEPMITILGGGRVSARAVVDLDAVRRQNTQRSLLDPMNWVSGRLLVTATGVLHTSAGVGQVVFESAAVGRLPIPKVILQEIVSYYSRSPENPSGLDLDEPFMLPARVQEIQVEVGRAIVVQ